MVVNSVFQNPTSQSLVNESQTDQNVIDKPETTSTEATSTHQRAIIIAVFTGLGLMTWESFITNRLPLLNLPSDVIEALRQGKIAYTKAREIAKVKDYSIRSQILLEASTSQLSLNEIKERLQNLNPKPSQLDSDITERFKGALCKIKKQKIWSNPKKRKQLENLLSKIEALIESETETQNE